MPVLLRCEVEVKTKLLEKGEFMRLIFDAMERYDMLTIHSIPDTQDAFHSSSVGNPYFHLTCSK